MPPYRLQFVAHSCKCTCDCDFANNIALFLKTIQDSTTLPCNEETARFYQCGKKLNAIVLGEKVSYSLEVAKPSE